MAMQQNVAGAALFGSAAPRGFGGPPPPGGPPRARGLVMKEAKMAAPSNDIFDNHQMGMNNIMQQQRAKVANDIGFSELDKTAEYMETHYYKEK